MIVFNPSKKFTIGAELELQIINRDGYDLIPLAPELLEKFKSSEYCTHIKPEITQSMLEINSSVHESAEELLLELLKIKNSLMAETTDLNIHLSGGGSHPFQMWNDRIIYPNKMYEAAAEKYGYLAKKFTVFGLHIHIGCSSGDEAIYLTNALSRYVPQLIALSASSPFCQGIDTDFDSSRMNVVNSFPLAGMPPVTANWQEFSQYIEKVQELKIVQRIDQFYWDVRPRPEFGTVEIRVCDAPLTIEKLAMMVAYAQTLSHFILTQRPYLSFQEDDILYRHNRFQASRYGFTGSYIDPDTQQTKTIKEDILNTCGQIGDSAKVLNNESFISELITLTSNGFNDASLLRNYFINEKSLGEIVYMQSCLFEDIGCVS